MLRSPWHGNRFKLTFTVLILLFIALSLSWHRTTPAFAQQAPAYRLIAPDLVAQGERGITALLLVETDKGDVPLNEGDEVFFQGVVVPVEPRGKITLPGFFKVVGNQFLVLEITRRVGGAPANTVTVFQHIEVLPPVQNRPTVVAKASGICTPDQPMRVTGQALDKLQKAVLSAQDGTEHQLGESVGSSLQRIYTGPKDLPKGTFHFVALDANGQRIQSPNQTSNPTLQINGTRIRRRGQRGQFTVSSDVEADVMLSGGAPQIQLDTHIVHVTPYAPGRIDFTALVVGDYKVSSRVLNREDVPADPQTPRVDANPGPVQTHYDPIRNETHVSCPVSVVDQTGKPVANTPVDVAVAHPNGVQYQRLNTGNNGRANFSQTFPGQLASNALEVHPYRVLGRAWKKQPPPPLLGPISSPKTTPAPSPSVCGPVPPHTTYTVKNLGPLSLTDSSVHCMATGVNDAGNVTGVCSPSYFGATGGVWHAFLSHPGDVIKAKDDLGLPVGFKSGYSFAMAVNSAGHVVGFWGPTGASEKAFYYDSSKMINLHPAKSLFKVTKAYALNSSDDVVGVANKGDSAAPFTFGGHAVLWLHGDHTTMIDLNEYMDPVAKMDWTLLAAFAINDDGHIVGRAIHLGKFHAFLLKGKGAAPIDLGALKEYKFDSSAAYSLNACDAVVGYTYTKEDSHYGFVWTADKGLTEIGTLDPYSSLKVSLESFAQAINKKGEVVGAVSSAWHTSPIFDAIGASPGVIPSPCTPNSHAVWYGGVTDGLKDLNKLIPDSPGWELNLANGINGIGQIAGSGFFDLSCSGSSIASETSKAVLLTPVGSTPKPTPAAAGTSKGYLFDNWNTSGVKNGPTKDTVFTLDADYLITFIADYHWNDGNGAVPGKGISVKDSHGTVFGPWVTTTSPGSGGALNVNWECHPGVVLPAGTYTVIDPDPATWSQNDASGNIGFTRVAGSPAKK